MFIQGTKMATRSRQVSKNGNPLKADVKSKAQGKTTTEAAIGKTTRDNATSVQRNAETHGTELAKSKVRTRFREPVKESEGADVEDEVRRSSRRRTGKSALELLGISPRKPRGPKAKDATPPRKTSNGEENKSTLKTLPASVSTMVSVAKRQGDDKVASATGTPSKSKLPESGLTGSVRLATPRRTSIQRLAGDSDKAKDSVRPDKSPKQQKQCEGDTNGQPPKTTTASKESEAQRPAFKIVTVPTPTVIRPDKEIGNTEKSPEGLESSPESVTSGTENLITQPPSTTAAPSRETQEQPRIIIVHPTGTGTSQAQSAGKRRAESLSEDAPSTKVAKVDDSNGDHCNDPKDGDAKESVDANVPSQEAEEMVPEASTPEDLEEYVAVTEEIEITSQETVEDCTSVEAALKEVGEMLRQGSEKAEQTAEASQEVSSDLPKSIRGTVSVIPKTNSPTKVVAEQTPAKRKVKKKKIVKAIVITPSGEKREIKLNEDVSTLKALEQILAGTTSGSVEDLAQLAQDVNQQIEASIGCESDGQKEDSEQSVPTPESQAPHLTAESELTSNTDVEEQDEAGLIEIVPQGNAQVQDQAGVVPEGVTLVSVDGDDKVAYEALSQLANGTQNNQTVTIELGESSVVDMDWLQQQGLQVVVAERDTDRWHRQMVGVDDPAAVAQLVNKMSHNKVRARPEKHLVASDDLQEMINNLQPDDKITNHTRLHIEGDSQVMRCKYCSEPINDRHQFRKHMTKHQDVEYKPWKCPICHYRAPVRAQIARHVNIHGELKPFVCKECGKGFNFKQKLLLHLKYHLDIRDRPCPFCSLAFHEHKTLKNHLKKIHKIDNVPPELLARSREQMRGSQTQQTVQKTPAGKVRIILPPSSLPTAKEVAVKDANTSQEVASTSQEVAAKTPESDPETSQEGAKANSSISTENPEDKTAKKTSLLYGTRKTFLYTQQYKMGLLPAADRNNVPASDALTAAETEGDPPTVAEKKRRRLVIPKITSTEQLEPVLQQYCRVEKGDDGLSAQFFCELCEIEPFTSKTGFIHHLEQRHPNIRAWQCPECPYTCRMRSSLIVHMKLHTGIKDYPCELCGKAFAFRQKLKNHMKHHMNLREYRCHLCEKAFNEKNDLTKHIKKVHNYERDCVCNVCGKAFKDQVQLRRHMDGHSNTRYLCEHCNKLYRSKVSLAQHMKCHTCMFHCEICDKNFGSYSGFMAHKVMHDESYEGYECDLCKKVLHTKGSLTRHLAISHSNERPHACEECGKQFKTKKDLKNHHIVHETDRKFACDVCEFTCKRPESLRVHMRRHCDVKPFQCGVCGKEYTQKHALETHLRHHTGKVEATCPICGREFFTRYQLETHIKRKHQVDLVAVGGGDKAGAGDGNSEEKPMTVFMCEECNSVFMSQDSLAVHILAEHMKQGWLGPPGVAESAPAPAATAESLLHPGLSAVSEDLEESPVGNTVEVITESDGGVVSSSARPSEGGFDGQQTIETLVSISDPGSTKQRLVSLIHPVATRSDIVGLDVGGAGDPVATTAAAAAAADMHPGTKETATEKLNALYEHQPGQEAYVAITDPASNQEMLVAMPHSNFESLLAATETEVQTDGTFINASGEDYITVDAATHPGITTETFVTIASDAMEPGHSMVTVSSAGSVHEQSDSCVAVAETIEIPIETESVTVLDSPK